MTINQNAYLQGIEAILTPNSEKKYIDVNLETKKCWRTSNKPDDIKTAEVMLLLAKRINDKLSHKANLSIGELETKLIYLKSIKRKAKVLSDNYEDDMNNGLRRARAWLSDSYSRRIDQEKFEMTKQYLKLEEVLRKSIENTEQELSSWLSKREEVIAMDAVDYGALEDSEILQIAMIAFEYSYLDEKGEWARAHTKMLESLYQWIVSGLDSGLLAFEDVTFIGRAIERGAIYFENFWVTFKHGEKIVKFNRLEFTSHNELISEYVKNKDQETNEYMVSEKDFNHLYAIKNHMITAKLPNLMDMDLNEILGILKVKYFQHFRSVSIKIFNVLNRMDKGIFMACDQKSMVMRLKTMTTDGGLIIQHPFIKEGTEELDLSEFDQMHTDQPYGAKKIFKLLIEYLPNLKAIALPVPCSINKECIDLLKTLPDLELIRLDFSRCNSSSEFNQFYTKLANNFKHKRWKLAIEKTEHLGKDDAIKILMHFPNSQAVSFEGVADLTDEDAIKVCINLESLNSLNLNYCSEITDLTLKTISEYSQSMKVLGLRGCTKLSEAGILGVLEKLGGQIRQLDLGDIGVTTSVAIGISDFCKNIECLSFSGCEHIRDAVVKAIAAECSGIQYYDLKETSITDEGVRAVGSAGNSLINISFNGCEKVTAKGVRELLTYCKELKRIDVRGTAVTDSELQSLKMDFPEVYIL